MLYLLQDLERLTILKPSHLVVVDAQQNFKKENKKLIGQFLVQAKKIVGAMIWRKIKTVNDHTNGGTS